MLKIGGQLGVCVRASAVYVGNMGVTMIIKTRGSAYTAHRASCVASSGSMGQHHPLPFYLPRGGHLVSGWFAYWGCLCWFIEVACVCLLRLLVSVYWGCLCFFVCFGSPFCLIWVCSRLFVCLADWLLVCCLLSAVCCLLSVPSNPRPFYPRVLFCFV